MYLQHTREVSNISLTVNNKTPNANHTLGEERGKSAKFSQILFHKLISFDKYLSKCLNKKQRALNMRF